MDPLNATCPYLPPCLVKRPPTVEGQFIFLCTTDCTLFWKPQFLLQLLSKIRISAIKNTNQIVITLFVWPVHIPKCRCIFLGLCMKSKCGVIGDDVRTFWFEYFINQQYRKHICRIFFLAKDRNLHVVNHCMAKLMIKNRNQV